MDNIFSYWPLIFIFLVGITRLINYIKKENNVIKKSKMDTSTDNKVNIDNSSEQDEKVEFEYDKEKYKERYEKDLEKEKENKQDERKKIKGKLKVKKIKKKSKNKFFIKREDIVKGIIMKEILDEPRFKKNSIYKK